MNPATARREAKAFLAVTYTLVLGIALAIPHAHINLLLSVMAPVTAVTLVIAVMVPSGERRTAWRAIGLGRLGRGSWLLALVIPIVLMVAAYGTAVLVGAADLKPIHLDRAGDFTANLVISLILGTLIILGEEIGWRGFLLPRVQALVDARRAAVVTGLFHGGFHLPLILLATTYDTGGSRWFVAPSVVVTVTAAGVFYAWLRDRSGSVWPAAIAHNAANTVFDLGAAGVVGSPAALAYVAGESGLATMAAAVVLAIVLLRSASWSGESVRGDRERAGVTRLRPEPQPVTGL